MALNLKSRNKKIQYTFPLIKHNHSVKTDRDIKKTLLKGKLYSLINKSNVMTDEELANTLEKFNGSNNQCLTEERYEPKKLNKNHNYNLRANSFISSNKFEDDRVKIEELIQNNFNNQERTTIFAFPQFFGIKRNPVFKEFAKVQSKNLKDVLDKEEVLFKNKIFEANEPSHKREQNSENSEEIVWFNYFYFNDLFGKNKKNKTKNLNSFNNNHHFIKDKNNKTFSIAKKNMSHNRVNNNKITPIKLKDTYTKKKLVLDYDEVINDYDNKDRKQIREDSERKMMGYDERRKSILEKRKRTINKLKEKYKLKHMKKIEATERDFSERKYVDNIISVLKKNYTHI